MKMNWLRFGRAINAGGSIKLTHRVSRRCGASVLGLLACLTALAACGAQPNASILANDIRKPAALTIETSKFGEESAFSSGRGSHPVEAGVTSTAAVASIAVPLQDPAGNGNPDATFRGCWHKQGQHRYQAVDVTVGKAGAYAFNAILYHGTTCNPNDFADQFGFGQVLNFGEAGYTFWFTAFRDQTDMSALWYLGEENSKCVSYESAPDC
jgi:hypothetical protein